MYILFGSTSIYSKRRVLTSTNQVEFHIWVIKKVEKQANGLYEISFPFC